jgi:hypothetical protein
VLIQIDMGWNTMMADYPGIDTTVPTLVMLFGDAIQSVMKSV